MGTKMLHTVTAIATVLALAAAVLSLVGTVVTGFYPGIMVLVVLAGIAIASRVYAKKAGSGYATVLTIINLLIILVVLWMTFVIVHDRVLQDCC